MEPDYIEQPVSIERFLDDDRYLGRALWDPEKKRSKIYPYWREKLKIVWEGDFHEIITTGPIGSGKSLFLMVSMAYMVHADILCLKDPFAYYDLVRAQPISLLFFSLSKDLSQVGLFRGFSELLLASPWFLERGVVSGTRHKQINFPQYNLEWSLGSPKMAGQGITGRNILGGSLDEISEVVDPKDAVATGDVEFKHMRALHVYQSVKRRIESRFMKGSYQPGKMFLASSKQDEAAFLEQYIERVKDQKGVLVIDDPLWEIKPRENYSGVTFIVAVGDRFRESKILDEGDDEAEYESKNFDLIDVPIEHRPAFDLDVDGAIRDIAGISSTRTRRSKLMPRPEYLTRCVYPGLVHPFSKDVVELSEDDDIGLEDYFLPEYLASMLTPFDRFIHLDLAKNGCLAGFGMCHSPGRKVIERVSPDGTTTQMADDIVQFDIMLGIANMIGSEIPFWKIRRFIFWLISKGVRVRFVTTDGWQSVDTQQLLHRAGVDAEVFSLDKNDQPYVSFRTMFYEERVRHYGHPSFLKEMAELEHNRIKKKVDHPFGGCFTAETRIPLLDGTCPTIEELDGREVWLYSSRDDGVTVPGRARGRFTKTVTDLVDVVLDSGAVVRCTPEHLWMLRDGTYKEAQYLRPGIDRLRPINRHWPVADDYSVTNSNSASRLLGCGRNVVVKVLKDNGFSSWDEFVSSRGRNHKIRHVIPVSLKKPVPVYDLEVDAWHNFALSAGVFVHNSKDVADGACGAAVKAIAGRDAEPEPWKQLGALKELADRLRSGLGKSGQEWWLADV